MNVPKYREIMIQDIRNADNPREFLKELNIEADNFYKKNEEDNELSISVVNEFLNERFVDKVLGNDEKDENLTSLDWIDTIERLLLKETIEDEVFYEMLVKIGSTCIRACESFISDGRVL